MECDRFSVPGMVSEIASGIKAGAIALFSYLNGEIERFQRRGFIFPFPFVFQV